MSSSGVTSDVPSAMDTFEARSDWMPMRCATSMTAAGPTSMVSCAATEFSYFANAVASVTLPKYLPSKLSGVHLPMRIGASLRTLSGVRPASSAAM